MKRKGINFRRADHLHWRHGNPETDKTISGRPVERNYTAIIRVKDCLDEHGRWDREKQQNAPCIPHESHSRSNMVYGAYRHHDRPVRLWVGPKQLIVGDVIEETQTFSADPGAAQFLVTRPCYWTLAVYWVEDNIVYQGTIRHYEEPLRLKQRREAEEEAA